MDKKQQQHINDFFNNVRHNNIPSSIKEIDIEEANADLEEAYKYNNEMKEGLNEADLSNSEKINNIYHFTFNEYKNVIWHLDYKSSYEHLTGVFEFKPFLPAIDLMAADRLYRYLLGNYAPMYIDDKISKLAYALAYLKYSVISYPDWWENKENNLPGSHITDYDLIFKIFNASIEATIFAENQLRKEHQKIQQKLKEYIKSQQEASLQNLKNDNHSNISTATASPTSSLKNE